MRVYFGEGAQCVQINQIPAIVVAVHQSSAMQIAGAAIWVRALPFASVTDRYFGRRATPHLSKFGTWQYFG